MKTTPFLMLTLCSVAVPLLAQQAVSDIVGYEGYTLPGVAAGAVQEYPISLPFAGLMVHSGDIASAFGNSVVMPGVPALTPGLHFVHLTSGPYAGMALEITASTPGAFTVAEAPVGAFTSGMKVNLRMMQTLESVFPANQVLSNGWKAGSTTAEADTVSLWNAATQTETTFYLGTNGSWYAANGQAVNAASVSLSYPAAVMIHRRGPQPLEFLHLGTLAQPTDGWLRVYPGLNLLGKPFTSASLANSGLYDSGSDFSMQGGLNAAEADILGVYEGGIRLGAFWYDSSSTGGWRALADGQGAGSLPLPLTGGLVLQRQGPAGWLRMNGVSIAAQRAARLAPLAAAKPVPKTHAVRISRAGSQSVKLSWKAAPGQNYLVQGLAPAGSWKTVRTVRPQKREASTTLAVVSGARQFRVISQ
jgi:hypothetical protein